MTAQEILGFITKSHELSDSLDNSNIGVKKLTEGEYTTRYVLDLEMKFFLLDLACCNGVVTSGETALLNLFFEESYTAQDYLQFNKTCTVFNGEKPGESMPLIGFVYADSRMNEVSGEKNSTMSDYLISHFNTMATLMINFDPNPVAEQMKVKYINNMKKYAKSRI